MKRKLLLAVILGLVMSPVLPACAPPGFEESIKEGNRERSRDNYRTRAYTAYADAFAYEKEFPYEVPEVLVLYRAVVSNYPGTTAAISAQKRIEIVREKRY